MTETFPISIIIPVKPGGEVAALEALRAAIPPGAAVDVLVAEGMAPSRQRNEAVRQAQHDIVYFLDDDSRVEEGFLGRLAGHFADSSVAAVGGPSLPRPDDTALQKAFSLVFTSLFGGGGMRNRYRKTGRVRATDDSELILCNLAFRKDLFLQMGGFDERLYPNEENELMDRIVREGWTLLHDPDLAITRSPRQTVKAFIRQLFGYGRGRAEQTLISGKIKVATLVPSLFLLYLVGYLFSPGGIYSLPLLCYGASVCFFSILGACEGRSARWLVYLPWLFPLFHVSYGAGFLRGLGRSRLRKNAQVETPVTIRRVDIVPSGSADG